MINALALLGTLALVSLSRADGNTTAAYPQWVTNDYNCGELSPLDMTLNVETSLSWSVVINCMQQFFTSTTPPAT